MHIGAWLTIIIDTVMKRLLVNNLGPIRNKENIWVEMHKVTTLCGPQGAGKSTIAKLISTFCWLEKALTRGDFLPKELKTYDRFRKKYCAFHNIQNYFNNDTSIRFEGDKYIFTYEKGHLEVAQYNGHDYIRPQVMYIPAERNLLNVVEHAEKIKGIPGSLDMLLGEYRRALRAISGTEALPLVGYSVQYDKLNQIAWLRGEDFKVRMTEAASGFQSLIPTILVSRNLLRLITDETSGNASTESKEESERTDKTIQTLLKDKTLDDATRLSLIKQLSTNKRNGRFLNIVEEIEQNLFPVSQLHVLYDLLALNNKLSGNEMVLTTHSPYIINYLSLAVKAGNMTAVIKNEEGKKAIAEIVPQDAQLRTEDLAIYEISAEGEIKELGSHYGIPDDNNYLNNSLEDANDMYDRLMDIEDGVCNR